MFHAVAGGADPGEAELVGGGARPRTTAVTAASPMAWKPAWRPASVQVTMWAATASASR